MNADTSAGRFRVDPEHVEIAAEVFGLLADPTRIRIVLALGTDELSVNHLADVGDKPAAAVSQHLAKLRLARMVAVRKDGNRAFYRLTDEHARNLVADALFQAEHAIDESPAHHRAGVSPEELARTMVVDDLAGRDGHERRVAEPAAQASP